MNYKSIALFATYILLAIIFILAITKYLFSLGLLDLFNPKLEELTTHSNDIIAPTPPIKKTTLGTFLSSNQSKYSYPVSEMSLNVDFNKKDTGEIIRVDNLDEYKFFCLNEILKNESIHFTYLRQKDKASIIIDLDKKDNKKKDRIVKEFKEYSIDYTIN